MHMIGPLLADGGTISSLWELRSFKATVAATLITLGSAVVTVGFAVWQWRKDYRWKQAELARELLDEIFDYAPSNDALRMVDGEEFYRDEEDHSFNINMNLVRQALPKPWSDSKVGPDVYVRWCFDALFYYLERIEQSVQIKLVRIEDLAGSTSYYITLMARDKKIFTDYAELIGFHRAVAFLNRFPEWRDTKS